MHYSTVAITLTFIPTLISAQLGTAYPGHFDGTLYARDAYAFPDPNYGNELHVHVKRAIQARYAEADALADAYAMAEAEAEAFPDADNVALLEGLYRRAAYAYPNAFAEPAKLTPEQCKAKVKSVTEHYQSAQEKYLYEVGQGARPPNKSQAMKRADIMLLWAKGVAVGHIAATQALKASGCPLPAGYEADTVKWENRVKDLERAVKNIKASPPSSR